MELSVEKAKTLRKVKWTFAIIYFLFMGVRAIFSPFITIYLEEKGLSAELIGLVSGINSFAIILSQPLWGIISDKIQSTKKTLILCIIGQAIFALSLIFVSNFFMIALAFCIYTSFSSAEGPLLDVWALNSIQQAGDANAFGSLKTWGCIGYAVASVAAGLSIRGRRASDLLPIFSMLLFSLALFMAFVKVGEAAPDEKKRVSFKELNLSRIFKDKVLLSFYSMLFLCSWGTGPPLPFRACTCGSWGAKFPSPGILGPLCLSLKRW